VTASREGGEVRRGKISVIGGGVVEKGGEWKRGRVGEGGRGRGRGSIGRGEWTGRGRGRRGECGMGDMEEQSRRIKEIDKGRKKREAGIAGWRRGK